jgi:hypothetical protein
MSAAGKASKIFLSPLTTEARMYWSEISDPVVLTAGGLYVVKVKGVTRANMSSDFARIRFWSLRKKSGFWLEARPKSNSPPQDHVPQPYR